ncbi:hypothetical protein [Hymenobacter volaticus]|uniref:Uncharacterized protein n=1 Tax=Hymenobacter volaticus TaxID=2932254 RepID=A0ABY4G1U8_9BACT|nr:hypothetical protein [Hymenobacter volaticus]UOQ64838.1 hypothetical protein MUN86_14835 [Hymenobacter volaticus]
MSTDSTSTDPITEPEQLSYAASRIKEAKITPEQNNYYGFDPASVDTHCKRSWKVFSANKDDNLQILYPTLSGR